MDQSQQQHILWSVRFFIYLTFWDWTGRISWNLVLNLFWQLSQKSLSSYLWQAVLMKIWGTFKTLLQFHFPSNIGKITLWWKNYDLTLNCVVLLPGTLPPERTQPQKLCTANFSSGTLKTLINRLLRLKNKIFWRDPCEKKPFFSRLKSDSQKYILKWSYWPEILAPGLKLIFVTTLFSNFFHFTQVLPSWQPPLKWGKGGIFALLA